MNTETHNIPAAYFENDVFDYEEINEKVCTSCEDTHKTGIFFNHLTNGNICTKCLNEEDLPHILGMNKKDFEKYKQKVMTQEPITT